MCPYDSHTQPQGPGTMCSLVIPSCKLHSSIPGCTRLRCPNDMQISVLQLADALGKQPPFAHNKHGYRGPAAPQAGPGFIL